MVSGRRGGSHPSTAARDTVGAGTWASLAGAGAMEEMPLEAEREGGNALYLPASWVSASYCPQTQQETSDMDPAGSGREG